MRTSLPANVVNLPNLRDQVGIFRNRDHAGEILAGMLEVYSESDAIVSQRFLQSSSIFPWT
jgi:hypothetical protein